MKKVIGFLMVAAVLGCTCIGQVPTQTIYAGESCQAVLPNYTQIVTVSDNCGIKSFTQTPIPGTLLTNTNPSVTVVLRAEDNQGNVSTRSFLVVLLDTISPVFTFPENMLSYDMQRILNNYVVFEPWSQDDMIEWIGKGWDVAAYMEWINSMNVYYLPLSVSEGMFNAYLSK